MLNQLYQKTVFKNSWEAFRSRGYPELGRSGVESQSFELLAELPPLLRALLLTDGTVTRALEAYFWESVLVKPMAIATEISAQEIPSVGACPGEKLLLRDVRLIGKSSAKIYASALSVVRLALIPGEIRAQLESGGLGIGMLIRESGQESYRELLDVGTARELGFEAVALDTESSSQIVYRTYRIYLDKRPAMLITEKFPREHYEPVG